MTTLAEPVVRGAMTPRSFAVVSKRRETIDTWTLDLVPQGGGPLDVEPGQFTMLYAFGAGEVPISVADSRVRLIQTVRAVGPVTDAICALEPGEVLGVRGPFGNSWPMREAEGHDLVIVAGGIGLAPLHGALWHALDNRSHYRKLVLLYGGRSPGDLLYRDELEQLRHRDDIDLDVTVDAGDVSWRGQVGVVPQLVPTAEFEPANTFALVVGPEIMMRYTVAALRARGVPPERMFLSMERNMRCGLGHCGHCQLGPTLICRDGPVYDAAHLEELMEVREL